MVERRPGCSALKKRERERERSSVKATLVHELNLGCIEN